MFTIYAENQIFNNVTMLDFINGFKFLQSKFLSVKLIYSNDHWLLMIDDYIAARIYKNK